MTAASDRVKANWAEGARHRAIREAAGLSAALYRLYRAGRLPAEVARLIRARIEANPPRGREKGRVA